MINKKALITILWACIENDCPLWEIVWELNSIPEKSEFGDTKTMALEILKYLVRGEYVEFFFDKLPHHNLKKIDKNSYIDLLEVEKYWNPVGFGITFLSVSTTEKGKELFYKL